MERVFFASGGSEAVESAIKLARQYALAKGEGARTEVISRYPAYHGSTFGTLSLTGYDPLTRPFLPMYRDMPKIAAPRAYLDRDNLTDEEKGLKYAEALRDKIKEIGPSRALAFIMEPVGGASTGALVAPDSYYQRIRDICDEYGILLIYDEVMTGVGRTGKFLAAEHWDQTPDIIVLGKGLGAGYAPLSAVVSQSDIVEAVLADGGFMHGYTYAGNPLACSAGLAVLKEILDRDLVGNAARMGDLLKSQLCSLMDRFPFIGDVRGKGLLLAFEIVRDRSTMEPLPREMNAFHRLVEIAYANKLVIYARRTRGGDSGDHFLVCPPMIVTETDLNEIVEKLTASLAIFARETGLPDRKG
jgi:adenosylmethionine-8-amino-7-oxononanoate aminotransferase